jgi:hypothetical protein
MMATHLLIAAALTVSGATAPSAGAPAVAGAAIEASEPGSRLVLNRFARCLAKERADSVRAVFTLPTGSREQQNAAMLLLNGYDRCGPAEEFAIDPSGLSLVGDLAEGLLAVQPKARNIASLASWNDQAIDSSALRPRNVNEDLGLCVVQRAPQETQRLLASAPESVAEEQAIRAVVPHLGPCAPAGAKLTFDVPTVRGQIAIAAYRAATFLSAAPATAPAPPK